MVHICVLSWTIIVHQGDWIDAIDNPVSYTTLVLRDVAPRGMCMRTITCHGWTWILIMLHSRDGLTVETRNNPYFTGHGWEQYRDIVGGFISEITSPRRRETILMLHDIAHKVYMCKYYREIIGHFTSARSPNQEETIHDSTWHYVLWHLFINVHVVLLIHNIMALYNVIVNGIVMPMC